MGSHRYGVVLIGLLLASIASADQGPPVYTAIGVTPRVGVACSGPRVQVVATTGNTWCCVNSKWASCDVGGAAGGAPGGVAGNLQTNAGGGIFGAYAGASCTAPNVMRVLSASGVVTCYQVPLDGLANPGNDKSFNMVNNHLQFTWVAPVTGVFDGAMEVEATGAFSGDLLHVHQHNGNPGPGTDLIHVEGDDADVTGVRITMPTAASPAVSTNATVNADKLALTHVTGSDGLTMVTGARAHLGTGSTDYLYSLGTTLGLRTPGPLTADGGFIGNASTATALAADPTDCAANRYATGVAANGNLTCGQVSIAGIAATGTPDATTVLTGNGTWTTPAFIGYTNVYDETTLLTNRTNLKFTGSGVTCTDSIPYTVCDVPAGGAPNATTTAPGVVLAHAAPYGTVTALVRTAATNQWDAGASSVFKGYSFDTTGYAFGNVKTFDVYVRGTDSVGSRMVSGTLYYQGSIWDPTGPNAAVAYGQSNWIPTADDGAGNATAGTYQWLNQAGGVGFSITDAGIFSGKATALATAGTTTTVLHGNAAGAPTYGAVDLANDTAATALPATKGGTGLTTTTAGSVIIGAATNKISQTAAGAAGTILANSSANTPAWLAAGTAGQVLSSRGAAAPVYVGVQSCTTSAATTCTITVARSGCTPVCSQSTSVSATLSRAAVSGTTLTCTFPTSGTNTCNCFCP